MFIVHHLPASRSHRILWLLEELGQPYEIVLHKRDPQTMRASPDLGDVSRFGKAPALNVDGATLIESGAIVEEVLRRIGGGRLVPKDNDARERHTIFLHFVEATAMPALLVDMTKGMGASVPEAIRWMLGPEGSDVLTFIQEELGEGFYLFENALTAADIMLWYAMRVASSRPDWGRHPRLAAYLARLEARPAFQAAVARGGSVEMRTE
ncbi:glutathione S-transferase family protein [Sphingomonas profundi]|uniref:glutathione S-transferase family protein n=1 Tax=Alterirhizorhabdus profundi TaxID=2681549 RepID=UPI0018D078CE|nr:glutathione S-transferase [Sphingomonas profundi]